MLGHFRPKPKKRFMTKNKCFAQRHGQAPLTRQPRKSALHHVPRNGLGGIQAHHFRKITHVGWYCSECITQLLRSDKKASCFIYKIIFSVHLIGVLKSPVNWLVRKVPKPTASLILAMESSTSSTNQRELRWFSQVSTWPTGIILDFPGAMNINLDVMQKGGSQQLFFGLQLPHLLLWGHDLPVFFTFLFEPVFGLLWPPGLFLRMKPFPCLGRERCFGARGQHYPTFFGKFQRPFVNSNKPVSQFCLDAQGFLFNSQLKLHQHRPHTEKHHFFLEGDLQFCEFVRCPAPPPVSQFGCCANARNS